MKGRTLQIHRYLRDNGHIMKNSIAINNFYEMDKILNDINCQRRNRSLELFYNY